MTKVLVTGGAGFIGSHVVEALLERSYDVRVLDNLSTGHAEYLDGLDGIEFIEGDITDDRTCREAVDGVSGIFHLAAMSKVLPSLKSPDMSMFCEAQNAVGTLNILRAAVERKSAIRKIIYSGSSTYYGASALPNKEDNLHDCQTFYAVSKYAGEMYCESFTRLYDLSSIRLRYFMAYGPRQPESGPYAVVNGVFMKRWANGEPLTILGDGTQTRDFVHVREVAEGNVRAFECDAGDAIINIGTGTETSILDLARVFSDDLEFAPPRVPDIPHSRAHTGNMQKFLGWQPTTDVLDHFKETVRALVRENPQRYRAPQWLAEEMTADAAT